MTTLADANQLRRAQSQVIGSAEGELSRVFRSLNLNRPATARDALLEAYPSLARSYGDMAATVSAEWYEELRRTQVGGSYSAMLAAAPPAERLTRTVRWAAGSLFTDNPGAMLSLLNGSMARAIGDASRDTVGRTPREMAVPQGGRDSTSPMPAGSVRCCTAEAVSTRKRPLTLQAMTTAAAWPRHRGTRMPRR